MRTISTSKRTQNERHDIVQAMTSTAAADAEEADEQESSGPAVSLGGIFLAVFNVFLTFLCDFLTIFYDFRRFFYTVSHNVYDFRTCSCFICSMMFLHVP